jgi:hypothetical protein
MCAVGRTRLTSQLMGPENAGFRSYSSGTNTCKHRCSEFWLRTGLTPDFSEPDVPVLYERRRAGNAGPPVAELWAHRLSRAARRGARSSATARPGCRAPPWRRRACRRPRTRTQARTPPRQPRPVWAETRPPKGPPGAAPRDRTVAASTSKAKKRFSRVVAVLASETRTRLAGTSPTTCRNSK